MFFTQRPAFAGPALFATCLVLVLGACDRNPSPEPGSSETTPIFELLDEAASGLDFTHENGMTGDLHMLEIIGSGAALLDYDRDGDLDLYLVQGGPLGQGGRAESQATPRDRLYRNDLTPGEQGPPRFTDVTEASGIVAAGYGMGAAVADYDGDGWTDLYVTNFGPNQLWRNRGDGTFEDATAAAGVGGGHAWSTSAAFPDMDGDGLPDLYVTNYVDFPLTDPKRCRAPNSAPDYCGPKSFPPTADRAYRNLGGGRFEEASKAAGFSTVPAGAGLGVIARDFDGDGRTDLFVANDGRQDLFVANGKIRTYGVQAPLGSVAPLAEPNQLFRGEGGDRFTDVSALAGEALAQAEVSRGAAFGDLDNDGRTDVVVTNNNGPVRVLMNRFPGENRWLGLELEGEMGGNATGARVEILTGDQNSGPDRISRWTGTDGSYLSANDPRLLAGLGKRTRVEAARIHWPGGAVEEWLDPAVDRYHRLVRGGGTDVEADAR